ncbi:hypothetical protein P8452_42083 [Trifolium repens]|nr:hypothetical protein P8452_42083 [Trifolium repens]
MAMTHHSTKASTTYTTCKTTLFPSLQKISIKFTLLPLTHEQQQQLTPKIFIFPFHMSLALSHHKPLTRYQPNSEIPHMPMYQNQKSLMTLPPSSFQGLTCHKTTTHIFMTNYTTCKETKRQTQCCYYPSHNHYKYPLYSAEFIHQTTFKFVEQELRVSRVQNSKFGSGVRGAL